MHRGAGTHTALTVKPSRECRMHQIHDEMSAGLLSGHHSHDCRPDQAWIMQGSCEVADGTPLTRSQMRGAMLGLTSRLRISSIA